MKYLKFIYVILFFLFFISSAMAEDKAKGDWSDLYKSERKYYGSEKEEKNVVDAFFYESENWEGHHKKMFFWFFKYTDYPVASSLRFWPFYYKQNSKIDTRKRWWGFGWPLLFYYHSIDGPEELTVHLPVYYSNLKKNQSDRSLFYLIWWGDEKRESEGLKKSYTNVLPLLYYSRYSHGLNNNKGSSLLFIPFFYRNWKTYDLNNTRITKSFNFSLLNYYDSTLVTGRDGKADRTTTWWAPLIPLTYHHTSPAGGHRNFLGLLDYSWTTDKNGDRLKRFWLTPVVFNMPGPDGYLNILPPVIMNLRWASGENYTQIFPIFAYWKGIDGEYNLKSQKFENYYKKSSVSLIHASFQKYRGEKKWDEEPYASRFWFPILPVYYSNSDPGGTHRNLAWFFDWTTNIKGDVERFWFIPLWLNRFGDNGYTHVIPPIFMSFRNSNGSNYYHLLPLFFSWRSTGSSYNYREKKSISEYSDSLLSIIYSRFTRHRGEKKWEEKPYSDTLWLGPFIPFIYYSSQDGDGIHKNMFWLFDWKRNSKNELTRFWFIPVFFSWKSSNSYYTYNRDKKIQNYRQSSSLLSIAYSRFKKERRTGESELKPYSDTFWIGPFIPLLYYSSEDSDGIHRNALWFIDWKYNPAGELDRFWVMPFVFHKTGQGGYRHYFPFYHRPSGWSDKAGKSYGIFHYRKWSEENNNIWVWPFYSSFNLKEKSYFSLFLPLAVSWKSEKSTGDIFLPVLFNYKSKTRSYHVNILGLSKTAALGPLNPDVSVDIGKYRGNWFLDTDISWLYDVLSFSWRLTLKNPFKAKENITASQLADNDELVEKLKINKEDNNTGKTRLLKKKKEFTRDNSEFFFGWKFLFGWIAYERADTKRHFRLIPLGWITYDKDSDDELITFPPFYLSYKSVADDAEYFVAFIFYGSQRQGKSYSKGYLLNLYWDEYDDDKKLHEKTILWPFINWYSSPEKSGGRFFPFFWKKWKKERGMITSKYISLLHYSHYRTDETGNVDLYKFIINPFYFSHKKVENNTISETTFLPLLPLYFKTRTDFINDDIRTPDSGSLAEAGTPGVYRSTINENYNLKQRSIEKSYLFPLYYWKEESRTDFEGTSRSNFMLAGLPLLYYTSSLYNYESRDEEKSGNSVSGYRKDYSFFLLGFNFYSNMDEKGNNFLFGLYSYRKAHEKDESEFKLLYGLLNFRSSSAASRFWLFPLVYYKSSPLEKEKSFLLGLYKSSETDQGDGINRSSSLKLLWGVYRHSSFNETEYSELTDFKLMKTVKKRNWLFPVYYYTGSSWEGGYKSSMHLSLLHYRSRESFSTGNSEKYKSTLWFPILPVYYRHTEYFAPDNYTTHWNFLGLLDRKYSQDYNRFFFLPFIYRSNSSGSTHTNILGFIDWEGKRDGTMDNLWVFPFYIYYPGEKSLWAVPPLLTYASTSPAEKSRMLLGVYWHSSKYYERQNFYYLYDHKRYLNEEKISERDVYSYLLTTVKYDVSEKVKKFKLFWGALLSYRGYNNTKNYEVSMVFNIINREINSSYSYSHLFPVYYYKNYHDPGMGWYVLSPVTLSYFSSDKNGDFDLGLLGLVYYRNNKIPQRTDVRRVLLGSIYNEVKKPERGYHSTGSLWGLLWEYETESETGFKKFSILKGLYKQVTYKGETRHKFFWIF